MNERRAIVGLCLLCALLVSALAVQSASASKGTTAFTCAKDEANGPLSGEHCLASGGTGKYKHVAISQDMTTEVSGSNTTTGGSTEPFIFKYTMSGVVFSFTATNVSLEGSLENRKDASGEHYVQGAAVLTLTGVTSSKTGCKVYTDAGGETGEAGVIHTEPLFFTTKGQGDRVHIEATEGEVLARFWQKECKSEFMNGTDTVRGNSTAVLDGATLKFTHAETTAAALSGTPGTSAGASGMEGSLTIKNKASGTPLSPTTVET